MNKKNPLSHLITVIGSFLTLVIGKIHWRSPPWVNVVHQKIQTRPKQFWGSLVALALCACLLIFGYQWYNNLPKPQLITAKISAPAITPVAEEQIPQPLIINFGLGKDTANFINQSVAPLKSIGKAVKEGIELRPAIKGEWKWENDHQLVFTPSEDWPAGQTYQIDFTKETFAKGSQMESWHYSFATQPFTVTIADLNFYQDPVNPAIRQVVATVNFNFPVDPSSFESHASLVFEAVKNGKVNVNPPPLKLTITYDKFKRVAYLRSENLQLPLVPLYLTLAIEKGVQSASHSGQTLAEQSKNVLIPDQGSYFKVKTAAANIIRNNQDQPEQVLTLETTLGVTDADLNKSLHVYLLPQDYPATKTNELVKNYEWQNPGEVSADILALSKPLDKTAIPADRHYATLHSYRFNASTPSYLYLKLDKGLKGFGDFFLNQDYVAIIKVPAFPREIGFLHKGALLALSGEKKLSVTVRGLAAVKFEIARMLPENINQLVTQTQGDFNNPYFRHQSFNQQNISQLFSEIQQFDMTDPSKLQYTALDLAKYVSTDQNTKGPQGLFLLQAIGWDPATNEPLPVKSSRLILMTDLGLVVKDNRDKTHDVFVQSITGGTPVANVMVSVLGKNGLPVLARFTDTQGRANFPALDDFIEDREPVVYLAAFGNDISFIPYRNPGQQLNYSRYDSAGLYEDAGDQHRLSAYMFTDRGIYRPGDETHIGLIVKQSFAQPQPAGLPLEVTVTDPRGATVLDQKFTLDASGFMSVDLPSQATSPTGQYLASLYIVKDNRADSLLGSTTFRLAEFQPDRMRISAKLSQPPTEGWISPLDLKAKVGLWNLYGAPAADRRISAKILLTPQKVAFAKYPDYVFADPLQNPVKPAKVFTDNLTAIKTDADGQAQFDLHLDRFDKATYQLTFFAEGFEAEGGRSVTTQTTALVSPLAYLLGYKTEGDLHYLQQKSASQIHFMAIDPQLAPLALKDLKIQLQALQPITTLVKKPDGTYQYQSIIKSTLINSQPFTVDVAGSTYTLPTDQIGDFSLTVLDQSNVVLSQLKFSVVGASQVALAQNAELTVKLNKTEYQAGEDIELQITAPYVGAGLMTIERDKVYAAQWFKTDTTSSMQTIRIPSDFEGNGYLNVAFVRDWNSPEIFISPLSYSVVPFTVNHANHAVQISLKTPELARPGEAFTIDYSTDRPGKIIVFAVDEGILQVTGFQTPDPLAFFFQKRALGVITQQTLDQILPKYLRERELSRVGGDEGEALLNNHLNPFKRKTDLPVVYWSGVVDTDSTPRQLQYTIPDYFNGSLRVMAVAVANDAVGAADKTSQVRGYFVVNPNLPTFAAPGDSFEVTASIANNVKDSGPAATVDVTLMVSPALEILGNPKQSLTIAEGKEKTVRYKLRTKALLGSATATFSASIGDKTSKMDATLSVRPASSFITSLISGSSSRTQEIFKLTRNLYSEYRDVQADMAASPLILIAGLQRYLDNFPFGCTEQLTSKAMPLLVMANQSWFGQNAASINEKLASALQTLRQRQMTSGGFSYWPNVGANDSDRFASVYAMHFITEARTLGYPVSSDLLYAGIGYLKEMAAQTPQDMDQARLQAYAIYLLTRNELVTTNYLTNLQAYLDQHYAKIWREDILGSYIAATYELLKNEDEALHLIKQYKPPVNVGNNDFYNKAIANAQYLYLIASHFPKQLNQIGPQYLMPVVDALNASEMNTVIAGYTSLALNAYAQAIEANYAGDFSMTTLLINGQTHEVKAGHGGFLNLKIDEGVAAIYFNNPLKQPFFYQITQSGFDKQPPSGKLEQGIEIYREYRDAKGNVLNRVTLGKDIEVHIQVRALQDRYLSNIAIVDLLPGGFEVVRDTVTNQTMDYVDVREDRVVFFTSLTPQATEIVYHIKATNNGEYTVPPIVAQSMYIPNLQAHGEPGKIEVIAAK